MADRIVHTAGSPRAIEVSEAEREAIFARRADELAVPLALETPDDSFEVLVFALGEERYAFPRTQVREVRPLAQLTSLPGTPAFVAGLANVRGRIVPVLDLRPLFDVRADEPTPSVVLVTHARGDIGILATQRPSVRAVRGGDLAPLPAGTRAGLDPTYVRGITSDLVIVLDADHLLADARLLVHEGAPSRA